MVDKKKSSATTARIEKGEIKVAKITITRKQPLFILFAYGGGGAADFLAAARYKEARIKKKYPDAEVIYVKGFLYIKDFIEEWTKLYQMLCQQEWRARYDLWEVHYFGHSGNDSFYLKKDENGKNEFTYTNIDKLEILPWHPHNGIFVLHSCRGAAYEDSRDAIKIKSKTCLAQHISSKQQTRCLGQVVYANFCQLAFKTPISPAPSPYSYQPLLTDEEKEDGVKYRSHRYINGVYEFLGSDRVLWGYALLTGNTGTKIGENQEQYEKAMKDINNSSIPKEYPIYLEVKKLADKNQILPCRVFNEGVLEEGRIVAVDVFNDNDLEYI